jgi:hypothetical protein
VVMWEIYSFGRTPYPKLSQKEVVENVTKGYRMECPEGCPKVAAPSFQELTLPSLPMLAPYSCAILISLIPS